MKDRRIEIGRPNYKLINIDHISGPGSVHSDVGFGPEDLGIAWD